MNLIWKSEISQQCLIVQGTFISASICGQSAVTLWLLSSAHTLLCARLVPTPFCLFQWHSFVTPPTLGQHLLIDEVSSWTSLCSATKHSYFPKDIFKLCIQLGKRLQTEHLITQLWWQILRHRSVVLRDTNFSLSFITLAHSVQLQEAQKSDRPGLKPCLGMC